MCFDNDHGDWTASVCSVTKSDTGKETRCDECGSLIAPHEWRKHYYLQEHEDCVICTDNWSGYYDESVIKETCEHYYGETFDYDRCRGCDTILKAIERYEESEGCPAHSRQPMLGELYEVLHDHEQADQYVAAALELDPALACHPILESVTSPENTIRVREMWGE